MLSDGQKPWCAVLDHLGVQGSYPSAWEKLMKLVGAWLMQSPPLQHLVVTDYLILLIYYETSQLRIQTPHTGHTNHYYVYKHHVTCVIHNE